MSNGKFRICKPIVLIDKEKCRDCGFCELVNRCHSKDSCIGCLSCYWACPYEARYYIERCITVNSVNIYVDGVKYEVPSGVSVAKALEYIGFKFSRLGSKKPSLPCRTGGCWACALIINGELERTCITPVKDGMNISTDLEGVTPKRIVHGPEPHVVGGKATPWWEVNYIDYVEAAIWVAGCNLRCPQCQNYHVTYDNTTKPLTPKEAAEEVVWCHRRYGTKGVAISGGEPTINRRWLIEFFKEVTKRVKPKVRRHLDSNGTLLTPDYIDELVEAGCNNIGVEPKCVEPETYMRITGLTDRDLALRYLNTAWKAIEYIYERYSDRVYLGVGLVYNSKLIALDELAEAGRRIASIDPKIQVTVLDYFPTFRRRDIRRPSVTEMLKVKKVLEDQGLKTVIVQTEIGHIGPRETKT
ncbi:MAG TPA: radical SAM protein [Acidilobales archaeon]|nr:radical SAM protein [Acidilobales archaeon]